MTVNLAKVSPIDPNKQYRPQEIVKNGWIVNNRNEPNYKFVLRLINTGKLKAQNGSFQDLFKFYMVMGHEIIRYRKDIYGLDSPLPESHQPEQNL